MELDIGIVVSLISEQTNLKMFPVTLLQETKNTLKTYSAESFKSRGSKRCSSHNCRAYNEITTHCCCWFPYLLWSQLAMDYSSLLAKYLPGEALQAVWCTGSIPDNVPAKTWNTGGLRFADDLRTSNRAQATNNALH